MNRTGGLRPAPRSIGFRALFRHFMDDPRTNLFVSAVIMVNAIALGVETVPSLSPETRVWVSRVDVACLVFFVGELSIRLYVHGRAFFRDPWSLFDAAVVAVALIPSSGPFAVLRAFRVLRVLRLLSVAPTMRRVVSGLLSAIPGLISILGIMMILFYVGAVIATGLYGSTFPDWFGDLGRSAYTLFQIMTLESWSMGIVRPVMVEHPYAWAFFIPFILIATFTMLNLFIAVIVNAVQKVQHETQEAQAAAADDRRRIMDELEQIEASLERLRSSLERTNVKE